MEVDLTFVDALGFAAAAFVFLTFCMRTMLALRVIAIASNLAFIVYAYWADLAPILVLHGALLPLNVVRLVQMQIQVRTIGRVARQSPDQDGFEWLIPMAKQRKLPDGATIFARGDEAESLFVIVDGEVLIPEVGVTLPRGAMFGEISIFSGDRRRTASAVASGPVTLAELSERRVQELYFDNPKFAYRLLTIITQRLIDNLARSEKGAPPPAARAEAAGE